MALTITQKPLAEVTQTLSAKTPIGAKLRSAEWARDVPAALRDEAFFSARVESVRALVEAQAGLEKILTMARDPNGALAMDRSKWIEEMQRLSNRMGLRNVDPDKRGGLEDFGSERRLAEIYRQQIGQAQSKAYHLSGQDPDVLDAWPAQELVRVRASAVPRDWARRWAAAGGKVVGGRMVALKTDPVWTKISRFGRPYPPFDFGSGMGVEEIDREEALGLIAPGEVIEPSVEREAAALERSVRGLSPEMRRGLLGMFDDDQIDVVDDKVRWRGRSEQGERALKSYTGSGFTRMNGELREGDESPRVQRQADRLNEALDRLPDYRGPVYRGTADDYDLSIYRDNVGRIITEPAFTSSSANPGDAFDGPVRFVIDSAHGKYVEPFSSIPGEEEVLFKYGTRFRVLDFQERKNVTYIALEEIE